MNNSPRSLCSRDLMLGAQSDVCSTTHWACAKYCSASLSWPKPTYLCTCVTINGSYTIVCTNKLGTCISKVSHRKFMGKSLIVVRSIWMKRFWNEYYKWARSCVIVSMSYQKASVRIGCQNAVCQVSIVTMVVQSFCSGYSIPMLASAKAK